MGSGRGTGKPIRTAMPASRHSSPRASTTTTTGPRFPRRNSRPRKTPRSRRPRSTRRPPGQTRFAREKQLLDEMTEIAEAARGLPDARVRKLVDWIRQKMCPDLPPLGTMPAPGPAGQVEQHPDPHLHRVRRHQALPPAAARGRHRYDRPGQRADRHLSRSDAAGRARGDQARVHDRPETAPGPHPDRHRRRARGPEPPDPLLEPVPFRRALEPEPPGAAQRSHRPQAPAQRRGLLPLLRLHRPQGRPHPRRCSSRRRKRSRRSWAASLRCSKAGWPARSSTVSATATSMRSPRSWKKPIPTPRTERSSNEELEAARERQEDLKAQIDRLRTLKERSQKVIALSEDHFRSAISCALANDARRSLEAARREATTGTSRSTGSSSPRSTSAREPIRPGPRRWTRSGHPASATRNPGNGGGSHRSGRSSSTTPGTMDQDVVHLHLEHRVVRRLLGRFTAQGFVLTTSPGRA